MSDRSTIRADNTIYRFPKWLRHLVYWCIIVPCCLNAYEPSFRKFRDILGLWLTHPVCAEGKKKSSRVSFLRTYQSPHGGNVNAISIRSRIRTRSGEFNKRPRCRYGLVPVSTTAFEQFLDQRRPIMKLSSISKSIHSFMKSR